MEGTLCVSCIQGNCAICALVSKLFILHFPEDPTPCDRCNVILGRLLTAIDLDPDFYNRGNDQGPCLVCSLREDSVLLAGRRTIACWSSRLCSFIVFQVCRGYCWLQIVSAPIALVGSWTTLPTLSVSRRPDRSLELKYLRRPKIATDTE